MHQALRYLAMELFALGSIRQRQPEKIGQKPAGETGIEHWSRTPALSLQ
jgi:hypothetical protein